MKNSSESSDRVSTTNDGCDSTKVLESDRLFALVLKASAHLVALAALVSWEGDKQTRTCRTRSSMACSVSQQDGR